ncbi:MAG: phospholipid-binding protein MlaC [Syntrophobacteraceae bacterium]
MSKRHLSVIVGIFAVTVLLLSSPGFPGASISPMSIIKTGTDRALRILKEPHAPGSQARRGEIMRIVDDYFNYSEMARRALGRPWKEQAPEKQREFVELFRQLLFNTYMDKVENYTGGNEKVAYDGEQIEGNYALVKTRIIGYGNKDIQVDYKLYADGGQWQVYDVVVEGISFINNYRQQFNSILTNEPFDNLLARMKQKSAL